ncbi:MAG: hypothetical protein QM783_10590 [Phycisphaerales bacterium]
MIKSLSVVALLALAGSAQADIITWNFGSSVVANGGSINASAVGGGLSATPALTRNNNNGSTDLVNTTSVSSGYAGATGTGNAGAAVPIGAINTNTSTNFQFTITPNAFTSLAIGAVQFGSRSTSTGPQAYSFRSSTDSYASGLFSGTLGNNSTWALQSGNAGTTITGATNFRIYGFGGAGSPAAGTANWRIDDLQITYSVLDSAINAGTPVNAGTIRRGASVNANMAIGENAGGSQASTNYSISYAGSSGVQLSGAATGSIANGGSVNRTLAFGGNTAGAVSGTYTIANTGNTADVQRAGANHEVAVTANIVDPSQASFSAAGAQNTLLIDFGTVNQGDAVSPYAFIIANLQATLGFTAGLDILAGDINATGDTGVLSANLAALTNLAAGSSNNYNASFDTSNMGSFSTTYTITGRDTASVQGGAANDVSLTINIIGTVVPTPGSAALFGLGALAAARRRRA